MRLGPETRTLLDILDRLETHVLSVRSSLPTAGDDVASVLHLLVGGTGDGDGYSVVHRSFEELGADLPMVAGWGTEIAKTADDKPVMMALRTSPSEPGPRMGLAEHLDEVCLRFAVPGFEPEANWTYMALIKKVRSKFGSHADGKPPRWLRELRYFPADNSNVVTLILWRADSLGCDSSAC